DLEQALEVAAAADAHFELSRAMGNLASILWTRGSLSRAAGLWNDALEHTREYGQLVNERWFRGVAIDKDYSLGRWDEALATADSFIAEVEAGSPHYLASQAYVARAFVRLARGDDTGLLGDIERALTAARRAKDPQVLYQALAGGAHVYREVGERRKADELANEFLSAIRVGEQLGFSIAWLHIL